jgi:outer membrane protein insertion porin family/translocation and assembly module TamA
MTARVRHLPVCLLVALAAAGAGCRQEEGIEVKRLEFIGVEAVEEKLLEDALATEASSALPWGSRRYFNRSQFETDLKRIVAFYRDRGFPDARVAGFDLTLSEDQTAISIAITIVEGEPVVVEAIEFAGFDAIPPDHLDRLREGLPLAPGRPRDRQLAQTIKESAIDELKDHGYPYAEVEVAEREGAAPRARVLTYTATPGSIAYFGPIEIVGNASVDDEVIRRQLTYEPGDLFRLSHIQQSQRRLYSLELFEFATIQPIEREQRTAEVPTRVTVAEGKHQRVEIGGGYGTEEKLRGDVNWRHVNFFGGARTAGVQGKWSSLDRGVRVNFAEPYFVSRQYSLNLTGQQWFADEPAYELLTRGARATVTRQLTRGGVIGREPGAVTKASLSYAHQFEDYTISNEALEDVSFRETLIALGLDPRTGTGGGQLTALDFDLHHSTAPNTLDPRSGYVASLHLEQAGRWLPGDFDYLETTIEGRHYLPIGPAVFATRAKLGAIAGAEPIAAHVPFFKRYFLGGSSSLRGWGRFQVAPLSGTGLPLGGHSMVDASAELRLPIRGKLGAVVFLDAGNVWDESWQFDLADLRYDIGPGLRYYTPIGPIRFDVAWQLTPIDGLLVGGKPQTRRWRMHFSIGQAF